MQMPKRGITVMHQTEISALQSVYFSATDEVCGLVVFIQSSSPVFCCRGHGLVIDCWIVIVSAVRQQAQTSVVNVGSRSLQLL